METRRDRDATTARVLDAAADLVTSQGAAALGVNALAKAAGCDKQLIYRYFGGIDGVQAALGAHVAERLKAALAAELSGPAPDWPAFSLALARGLVTACRADPLLCRLRAAELAAPPGTMAAFAAARGKVLRDWVAEVRPTTPPPPGVDVPALHALLSGAVEMAVLAATADGALAGMPLTAAQDWARLAAATDALIRAAYGPAARQGS